MILTSASRQGQQETDHAPDFQEWYPYRYGRILEVVRQNVIPYQWELLNDRVEDASPSFCMRNFKIAGKLMKEKRENGNLFEEPSYTFRGFETLPEDMEHLEETFYGFVFQDSDFSKWIEAEIGRAHV